MSEWIREVLLRQAEQTLATPAEQIMLAEVVGLRTILLNLLFAMNKGEKLTPEQMQQLIERADADKLKKALERLEKAQAAKGGTR